MSRPEKDFVIPEGWDRSGLPAWTYLNTELCELETQRLFREKWQLACHISDVPEPGAYQCFDLAGERAIIVRGRDKVVRAFHNVCRHRGSRVVAEEKGQCKSALICPFHGWAYNLDGTLRGVAHPQSLPKMDPQEMGLKPIEMEIWQGFVFLRFQTPSEGNEQPSVAEVLSRFEAEVAPYKSEAMVPAGPIYWDKTTPVNWKSVRDVDNEGYHVAMAHPGLHDLYGKHYYDEPFINGATRSFAKFNEGPASHWSVRAYKNLLPECDWLPESHQRAWLYIGMFPNMVISFYPDSVMFYQEFPVSPTETRLRGAIYRHAHETREMRAARYLSGRIDTITAEEDEQLTIWSNEAALSSGYDGIMLSDLEYGVKTHHDHLRDALPVMMVDEEPEAGTVAELNETLSDRRNQ